MALSDDALSTFALKAFRLGLKHGRANISGETLSSDELLTELGFPITRNPAYRTELWKVYFAGFDIGRTT